MKKSQDRQNLDGSSQTPTTMLITTSREVADQKKRTNKLKDGTKINLKKEELLVYKNMRNLKPLQRRRGK